MKVWKWIKDKAVWIALSLAILFLAVSDKICRTKRLEEKKNKVSEKIKEAEQFKENASRSEGVEAGLEKAESLVDSSMNDVEKRAEKIKSDVGGMDAEEVADRFNDLYGPDSRPN